MKTGSQAAANRLVILWVFLLQASPLETPPKTVEYEQNLGIEIVLSQVIQLLLLPMPGEPASEAGCSLAQTSLASVPLAILLLAMGPLAILLLAIVPTLQTVPWAIVLLGSLAE